MRQFIAAALVMFSLANAFAGERIVTYDIYHNYSELDHEARDFKIWNFAIVNVDKKVKITESEYCGDDTFSCTRREVLEKEKVLQLTVEYHSGRTVMSEDSPYEYIEVNFPLNAISVEELETMTLNSGFWDLRGRKAKARKAIAKKNFDFSIKERKKTIAVIDYYNSTLCDIGDNWCREDIRYINKVITVKDFSIVKK